ncbi:MAG: TonB-dependent receptor [Proteobacteria bacterium]|nr:TonB-dependent receptor [Pseudomonadota bacterium]
MMSRIIAALIAGYAFMALAEDLPGTLTDAGSTLRYQEEAVQWLPHSVTVIEKDELEATFRRDLEDLEGMAPGLIVDRLNTTPRGAAISIRGFGSGAASKAIDPAVAVNLDGIYLGTHTSRLQVLFDFEQVEIARGPQSVFEGDPNLAGSISIQRTRPTGELGVKTRATVGIDKRRELDVVFNTPVTDNLNAKLGVYWRDRGGDYMNNAFSNRDENTEDFTLVTGMLDWQFRDWFDLRYIVDAERSDEASPALLNITAPGELLCDVTATLVFPNCRRGVGNPELDSRRATAQNFSNDRQFDGDYHTLRVDFDYGGHSITSITGLRNTDEQVNLDLDASNADFYHVYREQDFEQFSQEITVRGRYSDDLDYAVGVYFLNTEYSITQQEFHILKQLGDAGFSEGHAAGEIQELSSQQKSNLQSIFSVINYTINDHWKADLGLRWTQVERDFEHSPSRIRLGNALSPLRTLLIGKETTKESLVSGGLSYKVDEEAMIYMRYSEGFLPGGFDENAMSAATGDSYGAETTRSAEIGLKSDWWEDRLRVNFAYFQTQLDNKVERVNTYVPGGNIESVLDNVATVEVSG